MMDIFEEKEEEQKLLLKKYNRQINAARIITIVMAVMAMVGALISMSISSRFGYNNDMRSWLQLGIFGLVFAIIGVSYVKPFVPLVLLSSITLFCAIAYAVVTARSITQGGNVPVAVTALSILVQLSINMLMIKGTIAAWKWQRLKKEMNN